MTTFASASRRTVSVERNHDRSKGPAPVRPRRPCTTSSTFWTTIRSPTASGRRPPTSTSPAANGRSRRSSTHGNTVRSVAGSNTTTSIGRCPLASASFSVRCRAAVATTGDATSRSSAAGGIVDDDGSTERSTGVRLAVIPAGMMAASAPSRARLRSRDRPIAA